MFEFKADVSDILTLATLLTTIYLTYQTSKEFSKKERQSLCLSFLERWESEYLLRERSLAWNYLHSKSTPDSNETIFLGEISYSNDDNKKEIYNAIIKVSHFFADLQAVWGRGMLDDELAVTIFEHAIQGWFPFLRRIDSRLDAQDDSIRFHNSNKWRIKNVLPLERLYEQRRKQLRR